jgi:hypothetical protein
MADNPNALRWDGAPGHYEVYYLSATDRGSGCGLWIRYTMLAPKWPGGTGSGAKDLGGAGSGAEGQSDAGSSADRPGAEGSGGAWSEAKDSGGVGSGAERSSDGGSGAEATCSLWLMAMDPERRTVIGRKRSWPIAELTASTEPFELRIGPALLTDTGTAGAFEDVAWDLRWRSRLAAAEHVHPLLRRARLAKTVLTLPHPDLELDGTVSFPGRELRLDGARGGQAHLWGSKHAARWTWAHCNDFEALDGEPRPGTFLDGVSVFVPRLGRELGPNTPVVGCFGGRDFRSIGPLRVTRNASRFGLTSWRLAARDGGRRIEAEVDAERDQLAGVTYHDPDGQLAYCYNSETATMRVRVWDRDRAAAEGWRLVEELAAPGRAHFEYAQRERVPDVELHVS